jgi:hypothetical protein
MSTFSLFDFEKVNGRHVEDALVRRYALHTWDSLELRYFGLVIIKWLCHQTSAASLTAEFRHGNIFGE